MIDGWEDLESEWVRGESVLRWEGRDGFDMDGQDVVKEEREGVLGSFELSVIRQVQTAEEAPGYNYPVSSFISPFSSKQAVPATSFC